MTDFCIQIPYTVSGDKLEEQFREYAENGTDGDFKVRITDEKVLDYDRLLEKASDPAEVEKLSELNDRDERQLEQSSDSYGTPPDLAAPQWFFEYKDGIEVEVRTKRTASLKDAFFPLKTEFRIAPDEEYSTLNENTGRLYDDDDIEAFEDFAEELIADLGLPYHGDAVTEDIPADDDADHLRFKGQMMYGNPSGRDFLF